MVIEEDLKKAKEIQQFTRNIVEEINGILEEFQIKFLGEKGRSESDMVALYTLLNHFSEQGLTEIFKESINEELSRKYSDLISNSIGCVSLNKKQYDEMKQNEKENKTYKNS